LSTEFDFHRISPTDPNIAVFKAKVNDEHKKDIRYAMALAGIDEQNEEENIERNIYRPPHTIFIRRAANDTVLPNYSIDLDSFEVSCDWKGLFTAFCYEEKLRSTFDERYVS